MIPREDTSAQIRRVDGDLDASFAVLVGDYERPVLALVRRYGGDDESARDLAAETFLRAYRALLGYSDRRIAELEVRPWLMTIALNVARNAGRDARRRPRQVPLDGARPQPATGPQPDDAVERLVDSQRLGAALMRLPDAQRAAVLLRHVVGVGYEELAATLGCPVGTAKSHVSRGLESLRRGLTGTDETGTGKTGTKKGVPR